MKITKTEHDPRMYSDGGYWFSTTHGEGPGTIPRDTYVLDRAYEGYKTFLKLNRFLTTEELNQFDLKEEVPASVKQIDEDADAVMGAALPHVSMSDIGSSIDSAVASFMEEHMGYEDDEVGDYYKVTVDEVADEGSSGIKVQVRAELNYEEFEYLIADSLDPIIEKFDKDAYFEMDRPGIAEAYIWDVDVTAAEKINPPGDPWQEDIEYDYIAETSVDTIVEVAEDGDVIFGDGIQEAASDITFGEDVLITDDEYGVRVERLDDVCADIESVLEVWIPDAAGTYHVTGDISLVYNISNVFEDDDEINTDEADAKFDMRSSVATNVQINSQGRYA